jgi:putative ABC transport system substrate-binding protein
LSLNVVAAKVQTAAGIDLAIETFAREPNAGLLAMPDNIATVNRQQILALAARYRLPALSSRPAKL